MKLILFAHNANQCFSIACPSPYILRFFLHLHSTISIMYKFSIYSKECISVQYRTDHGNTNPDIM